MISRESKETLEKLEQGKYINNRVISLGGVPFSARDVMVKAPLAARLNVYFVGGTGRGKTQLGNDLIGYFGDSACYAMGRPDFEPSELLRQVRLGNLKNVETDRELVELTENVRKQLFFIDELNRAPPIVQNYYFDFFDGKLVHNGKILNLGTDGYSIGFATGNLGDGEYVGVSDSDRALKDRMHLIVKLDHPDYRPTPTNLLDVFKGKKNPHSDMPSNSLAVTGQEIIKLHTELSNREVDPLLPLIGVYLTEGLDYLDNVPNHSKSASDTRWPNISGIRTDTDEDKVFPLSPRSVLSAIGLTSALEMIAESKGHKPKVADLFLDALRFTVPYSGVLSPTYVEQTHAGDVYGAFDNVFGTSNTGTTNTNTGIRQEVNDRVSALEQSIALAEAGETDDKLLNEIAPTEGRWTPVKRAIQDYAERVALNPTEETRKLKAILEQARKRK